MRGLGIREGINGRVGRHGGKGMKNEWRDWKYDKGLEGNGCKDWKKRREGKY